MKKICNLPRDLTEEVLSRVPLTSLRRVRSTCKKWNTLSKDMSFAKKHLVQAKLASTEEKGLIMVMVMDYRVYLMRFSLSNNVDESCIKSEAKLIGPNGSDEMYVRQVIHCDGLLLCVTKDNPSPVVWNLYWGQTRWIRLPTHNLHGLAFHAYTLGYDKSSNSHKILRFVDFDPIDYKIYEFNSDSWRVLDVPLRDWRIEYHNRGLSLKGNTYWFARKTRVFDVHSFLVCFDFTRETFGPPLRLPFVVRRRDDTVSLSSVRDEQLAVLLQSSCYPLKMEIWVTTKIEPHAVSWSSKVFLSAKLFRPWRQVVLNPSFFIDEEKKVAVVFDRYIKASMKPTSNVAYIVGVDGSLKEADARESAHEHYTTLVSSYVPSLVQLN